MVFGSPIHDFLPTVVDGSKFVEPLMVVASNALVAAATMKMIVTARTRTFEVAVWVLTWYFAVEIVGGISVAMIESSFVA